jgi:hypothetical protein
MSTDNPERALPAPLSEAKRRPIPRPVRDAIELIATGRAKDITTAAQRIGWERSRLSKWLSRPECIAAAKERAAKAVAVGALRSGARLNELVDSESSKVSLEAAKFSLQTAGIGPARDPSVSVNLNLPRAGFVLDLSERPERRSIDANGKLVITPIATGDVIQGEVIDAKPE